MAVAESRPEVVRNGAADALRTALAWSRELDLGGISRADILRREGLSRARVTQILRLVELPDERKRELLDGIAVLSIRGALGEIGSV